MSEKSKVIVSVGFVRRPADQTFIRAWRWSDVFLWPALRDWVVGSYMGNLRWRHCEIAFGHRFFPEGKLAEGHMWAYGIMRHDDTGGGGKVFGKERTFSNPGYSWIHLELDMADALVIHRFCKGQVGKLYDYGGGERSVLLPRSVHRMGRYWYCANLTACALQQAGILTGLNPNVLTMDDIYRMLKNHPTRMTSTIPFEARVDRVLDG